MKIIKIISVIASSLLSLVIYSFSSEKNRKKIEIENQTEYLEEEFIGYESNTFFIKDYLEIISSLKRDTKRISQEGTDTLDELYSDMGKISIVNKIILNKWGNDENEKIRKTVSSLMEVLNYYDEIYRKKSNMSQFERIANSIHRSLVVSAEDVVQLKLTEEKKLEILRILEEDTLFDFEEIKIKIENGEPVKGWDVGFFLLMMKMINEI